MTSRKRMNHTGRLVLLLGMVGGLCGRPAAGAEYRDPSRFDEAMQRFAAEDQEQPPPLGAIVCTGSSSMRGWHSTIHDDLAPLTIIPRGFGGSNMNEALHYIEELVFRYDPRAVVLYEGDNDVAQGIAPETIAETFDRFVERVHQRLPECRIYFLSIKPSIRRWALWPAMQEANRLIEARCGQDERLTYVDVAAPMLDENGEPRGEIFRPDDLHMTRDGYVLWKQALRPVLLPAELPHEPQ